MAEQYSDSSKLSARAQLYQRFSTEAQDLSGWVFDRLDLGPRSRVLELGCGPGHLWSSNMRRIPDGWSVTLTDMSPGMLKEAEDNLAGSAGRFSFEVVDAQSIPYGDSGFDTVIANHMLYHVPDRPAAFSEIHRVLTAGGRLFATTLGRGHLRKLYELVEGVAPGTWRMVRDRQRQLWARERDRAAFEVVLEGLDAPQAGRRPGGHGGRRTGRLCPVDGASVRSPDAGVRGGVRQGDGPERCDSH